jgi:lipopolysaccharide biosynthesis protein
MTAAVRALAFYLPQYHPIPENDSWWGSGFTEWHHVAAAKPLFSGHEQPHLPADLGYYDLRSPEVRQTQADLARRYGIHGFCYYHYWFHGRRILERPFEEVLATGRPDFPFCLCWANENWTRVWDGGESHVLLEQRYSAQDDVAHITGLIPAFRDSRYVRIDGRPLFLVYRSERMPDPERTTDTWREVAAQSGVGDLYLARVEGFQRDVDPVTVGFDAAVEFAPDGWAVRTPRFHDGLGGLLSRAGLLPRAYSRSKVVTYESLADAMRSRPDPPFKRFRCVTPMWDNSPRRERDALIVEGSTPHLYERWLSEMVRATAARYSGDERIVFINAWNEWGESCHLEPDARWGHAYLEATRRVIGGEVSR